MKRAPKTYGTIAKVLALMSWECQKERRKNIGLKNYLINNG